MEQYSSPPKAVKTKDKNNARVTVGQVFMQPTKNNTNFKYCYFGLLDKDGKFVAGFTMSNANMLEAVEVGVLSKNFLPCFKTYAEKYIAIGKEVL